MSMEGKGLVKLGGSTRSVKKYTFLPMPPPLREFPLGMRLQNCKGYK